LKSQRSIQLTTPTKVICHNSTLQGQATYQSEVTKVPISIPNISISELSKDQYKLYGEVSQPITDLFTVKDQKELVKANSEIEVQKIEVELYKLKERINNLFSAFY
jgi:hypothetical protein